MKKLILSVITCLMFLFTYAQNDDASVYQIYQSEFYTYDSQTERWNLETQNKNVNISMVFYKDAINIQARTPTLFKIKMESKKPIRGNGYYGFSFDALECVDGKACKVDYVYLENDKNAFMLSVSFKDDVLGKVNLRYYSTLNY